VLTRAAATAEINAEANQDMRRSHFRPTQIVSSADDNAERPYLR
jgi:hypothetical protein